MVSVRWYTARDVATELGCSRDAARKRIYRFQQQDPDSEHVRTRVATSSRGRPTTEIDDWLLAQWRPTPASAPTKSGDRATTPRLVEGEHAELLEALQSELELMTAARFAAETEVHEQTVANLHQRLEAVQAELSATREQLTVKEFELAEERSRLRQLGQTIAALTD